MRTHIAMRLVLAGVASVIALSGCTRAPGAQDPSNAATPSSNASPTATAAVGPSAPVASSLPAGIPTVEPVPPDTLDPNILDGTATITLATIDPDTGGLLVGGYISGVAEDGGDCQYIITPEKGESFIIHQGGVENNGSTSCGSATVPKNRVPGGTYSVELRYSNDVGQVESDPTTVVLP